MLGSANVHYNEIQDQILSDREILILQMLSDGLSTDEIGSSLGLTGSTVQVYISSCIKKLAAQTIPHVVKIATLQGYIS